MFWLNISQMGVSKGAMSPFCPSEDPRPPYGAGERGHPTFCGICKRVLKLCFTTYFRTFAPCPPSTEEGSGEGEPPECAVMRWACVHVGRINVIVRCYHHAPRIEA